MSLLFCLLFSIMINQHSGGYVQESLYKYVRLEEICSISGSKVRLPVGSQAHVFSFNSSTFELNTLKCHLELSVPSSLFGLSIFLEEMALDGSEISGCQGDFVQFGRDILFVTTHMSRKYCGDVQLPVSTEGVGVTKLEFPGSALDTRIYREESDREMDIWIHINSPEDGQGDRSLTLVVTPFRKTCGRKDSHYRKCGFRSSCVRKELFCDGRVNCAWPDKEPRDEYLCKKAQLLIEDTWEILDISLLTVVIVITLALLIACVLRHYSQQSPSEQIVSQRPCQLPPLPPELLPSCPPPYSIENASHYIEQDANKPPTCDLIVQQNL